MGGMDIICLCTLSVPKSRRWRIVDEVNIQQARVGCLRYDL